MPNSPSHLEVDELTQYFLEALTSLSLSETAKYHAKQAQAHVHDRLTSNPAHNQIYTTPEDLSSEDLDMLAKQSLDAHLKQVQSAQLAQASQLRLEDLQAEASRAFRGKRVRVTCLTKKSKAISPLFVNNQTGRQTLGVKHPQIVVGKVQAIYLEKNIIIIKPTLLKRWTVPTLDNYVVYPLSPETLKPDVKISV